MEIFIEMGHMLTQGLGFSRSTKGFWSFRSPFVLPQNKALRKAFQPSQLRPDDVESAIGLAGAQG
jgi:hypothetical protein